MTMTIPRFDISLNLLKDRLVGVGGLSRLWDSSSLHEDFYEDIFLPWRGPLRRPVFNNPFEYQFVLYVFLFILIVQWL